MQDPKIFLLCGLGKLVGSSLGEGGDVADLGTFRSGYLIAVMPFRLIFSDRS